jgi:4-amino-4-deoxy-L-arabinose transferase-like glycosyltransferase
MHAGIAGAFVLLTMMHYTWLGRVGRIDMALTFMTTVALAGFYLGYSANSGPRRRGVQRWLIPAYFAVALALLLKGPIGIVLPAAVVGIFLFLERGLKFPEKIGGWIKGMRQLGLWWGVALIILVASPWYLWVNVQTNGAFFEVFFWKHNIERGLGGGALTTHPWWFYGPRVIVDLLPWSLVFPFAAWLTIRRGWWRSDPEARFGLVWFTTILLILSCSRFKRADYLLPAYPGAALFLGCMFERWYAEVAQKKWIVGGFVSLVLCYALAWNLYLSHRQAKPTTGQDEIEFASEIRRRAPSPQLILFFRTEAHALAFHVGRPIDTILEWENLDTWAARPEIYHVVMPSEYADDWRNRLRKGALMEIVRSGIMGGSTHSDPLVLLRTHPEAESPVP